MYVSSLDCNISHSSNSLSVSVSTTMLRLCRVFILPVILHGAETFNNYWETSTHLISGVCVAYYELPGETAFQMEVRRRTEQPPLTYTSSVPLVSSSLATSHVLIHSWTTAERWGPVWPPYQGTNRRSGWPRQTWLHVVEFDVASLNIGLATVYHRA